MEFFKEILGKIWYILYPFLFYYAVMLIIMTIAQWAFGGDATHYVFCQLIATVFTIPSMLPFYRQGQALWNQPGTYLSCTFCGRDYGMLWNFFEQSHIHDETDGNFDGLPAGKYRFLRKYNRNGNSLSGSIYPDSGRTGIPGNYFRKIKRYAVETVCGWNFGIDFCGRACQYRAVYLRTDSWCGAGTSDGSCGKCLCIHDRTYDGKFYCGSPDGNALAGFQCQGRCGRMDIFPDDTGSWDCADVAVFV